MKASFWIKLLSLVLIGVLLTACGTAKTEVTQTSSGNKTAELKTVKVGLFKIAGFTNAWVAQQQGIFEKNGLKVEFVELKAGDTIQAQHAGDVDIILQVPGTVMSAVERGFDLVAIFQNETARSAPPDSA